MIDALYISASGLRSEQKEIDVISNNVANLQTPGFKRTRVNFVELAAPSVLAPSSAPSGQGSRVLSTSTLFTQGDLRATQNALDVAIDGAGFFELEGVDGNPVYTRDGQFRLDADGYFVSPTGLRLARGFTVPQDATDLRIARNGEVTAMLPGETERTVVGTLEVATFPAADALESIGNNLYRATDAAGVAAYGTPGEAGAGALAQGQVELANVEMVDEMTNLVLAQRAYQLNARVLQASDQILETINNLRR
jgi:flagellar basal-body rod protein FlgG